MGTGNPPRRYDAALALKEMNQVWYYEPADLVVSVEPGMKFGDFQHFVGRHKLWLPLDPPGGARSSLGGILAANASGPLRQLYGSPRDMVLGMKIATTEGKLVRTGGRVVKNVAGYDLAKLLIGSYGTLGVIVEASLKLYPLPAERATFILSTSTPDSVRDLRRSVQQSPLDPMRMVLLNAEALKIIRSSATAEVPALELWIEVGGSPRVIERYARTLEALSRASGVSVRREDAKQAASAWPLISDFRAALVDGYPDLVVLKAALPIASSEEFISQAQQAAASQMARLAALALVGVGVVHLYLPQGTQASVPGLVERLRRAAVSLGGQLVVEWCSVPVKARIDVWGAPGDDFETMQKLKQAWDPKGILSPGRFIGGL
jgi:glycolate oxidase FAD binding subunit